MLDDSQHRLLGQAPLRPIEDADEGLVVVLARAERREPQVGERVEDGRELEQALAAQECVRHAAERELLLQRLVQRAQLAGLEAAEEARHLAPRHALLVPRPHRPHQLRRLLGRRRNLPQLDRRPRLARRRERLCLAARALLEQHVRDPQDVGRRPVVVDERAVLVPLGQPRKVARLGPAEAVDALVVVSDDGDLRIRLVHHQLEQLRLHLAVVLVLVHDQVRVRRVEGAPRALVLAEQSVEVEQHRVEVEPALAPLHRVVPPPDVRVVLEVLAVALPLLPPPPH